MKRPPGLWILLSAGFLWLNLNEVYGVRATALIFGKSTTTTTTTTTTTPPENISEDEVTTEQAENSNSTKPSLTGNPQLDYVWDPNLPKELNGYNLSDYPFYERVPEDIDFKCDGLHDGFYASVTHKCQVYHHCLFGVRYDFLCANYTAFDQTLFNCNFVSNVDCQNSKKFWHRNDELYITKSTTTAAPVIYNFRTPPTNIYALTPSPGTHITADQLAVIQQSQPSAVQPQSLPVLPVVTVERRRPRPPARRRPAYDYYDYEERPLRERPRARPFYFDYDDYEDERYERRGGRRRRPYDRRPMRRDKDRRREYDYEDEADEDYDFTLAKKRRGDKRRKQGDEYEDEEKRIRYNRRRPDADGGRKKSKRPVDYDDDEDVEPRRSPLGQSSIRENRKPSRFGSRRPPSEIYEDDLQQADDDRLSKKRKSNKDNFQTTASPTDGSRAVIKPVSGTLYDRPRLAPKINLPVPKNAAHKYAYKPLGSQTKATRPPKDEEYDDVEENPEPADAKKSEPPTTTSKTFIEVSAEDSPKFSKRTKLDLNNAEGPRLNIRKRPIAITEASKEETSSLRTEEFSSTTASQEDTSVQKMKGIMRKFRRPFLPSRGGNPYTARNLRPVGEKFQESEAVSAEGDKSEMRSVSTSDDYEEEEIQERRPDKTKPVRVMSPLSIDISADLKQSSETQENSNTGPIKTKAPIKLKFPIERVKSEAKTELEERTTKALIEKLYENYDETLNEASPVLSFSLRKYPTGLGNSPNYINDNRYYRSTRLGTN